MGYYSNIDVNDNREDVTTELMNLGYGDFFVVSEKIYMKLEEQGEVVNDKQKVAKLGAQVIEGRISPHTKVEPVDVEINVSKLSS